MNSTTTGADALAPSALPDSRRDSNPPTPSMNGAPPPAKDEGNELVPGTESTLPTIDATPSKDPEPTVAASALAAKVLQFASTASPGTIGGIAVGVSAVLYLILGRLSLLIIGAFGGVLGFVMWEARHPEVARAVRGEKGVDILERILQTRDLSSNAADDPEEDEQLSLRSLDEFRPETREALGSLLDAIIRDYVKYWYSPIIPTDHSFPLACRKTLTSYFLSISNHLYRKRPADSFLDLFTNSSSMVIVFMSELAAAFVDVGPESNMSAVEAVSNYRAEHPDCHLNNLLNQQQQSAKFRMVAEDLLRFLDRSSNSGDPAWVFLREIIGNSVLESTLQTCSKADWINGWIVYLLEAGEPDLNQAIDVGMQTGRDSTSNSFVDLDGNVGNIGIAKAGRTAPDSERLRAKSSQAHKKKLSKADEEMEVAMEEMKKLNAMIAEDERRRERASTIRSSSEQSAPRPSGIIAETLTPSSPGALSPTTRLPAVTGSPPDSSTDGVSSKGEAIATPITPRSTADTTSQSSSPRRSGSQFTNFDQVQPMSRSEDGDEEGQVKKEPLTLHNASFTLHDDTTGDKGVIRSKPNWDYLIQVEPSSAMHPGWMIVRRYSDFETLHEILRRIAAISGATAFTELHRELPAWKIHTRESLRGELERYLRDACWYMSLAESEGMKRFLEKSQGHTHGDSKTFGWESVGKNMLDVLSTAPKGAMEGGKTLVGGVQGVFGNFPGLARKSTNHSIDLSRTHSANRLSISTPPRMESKSPVRSDRASIDSQRSSVVSQQPGKVAPMERRPSYHSQQGDLDNDYFRPGRTERMDSTASGPGSGRPSREHSRASSVAALRSPSAISLDNIKLPPPPDETAEDYEFPGHESLSHKRTDSLTTNPDSRQGLPSPSANGTTPPNPLQNGKKSAPKPVRQYSQLSEPETRVAVELLFAVINEMYTLSSAWNIRRTLLAAAKSFLLRPGNPSLLTVQNLIQTSVLDTYTSDSGIATQLRRLRENTMPTEQERASWPAEMTDEERERLRVKARRLLIQSGVPAALMGVMGQAATSEALGRVFDCLQIEEVARGLMFGLLLQVVRVITH